MGQLPPSSQIDHIAAISVSAHPSTSTSGGHPVPVSATTNLHPQLADSSAPSSNTSSHPAPMAVATNSHPHSSSTSSPTPSCPINQDFVFIGLGLPPIAKKLFERIEAGSFIKMAELLPENLNLFTTDADQSISKIKRHVVTNLVKWLQCFSTYVAIVSYKQPDRVSDLLGLPKPYHTGFSRL